MTVSIDWETRRSSQRAAENADQVEFSALLLGSAVIEQGLYDDRIANAYDDYSPGVDESEVESWHYMDLKDEAATGDLLREIERRINLMGPHYPFSLEGNSLVYQQTPSKVYEFCLAICNSPSLPKANFAQLPRQFEHLSCRLMERFLGNDAKSHHTGWPYSVPGAVNFKNVVSPLNSMTNEWHWQPDIGLPDPPSHVHVKDERIDFVAWKENIDRRVGRLFYLGQCACGGDWQDKYEDVNVERLQKWFGPLSYIKPTKVFCTPFHITDAELVEASRNAGIVLDRARFTLLARDLTSEEIDTWAGISIADRSESVVEAD